MADSNSTAISPRLDYDAEKELDLFDPTGSDPLTLKDFLSNFKKGDEELPQEYRNELENAYSYLVSLADKDYPLGPTITLNAAKKFNDTWWGKDGRVATPTGYETEIPTPALVGEALPKPEIAPKNLQQIPAGYSAKISK